MASVKSVLAVVPQLPWSFWESSRERGQPATHAVLLDSNRTLCGKLCDGWEIAGLFSRGVDAIVTCKPCLRQLARLEIEQQGEWPA